MKLEIWVELNKEDPYPSRITRLILAKESNLLTSQVENWLKYRRAHLRLNKKFNLNSLNRLSVDQKLILIDFYKHFNKFPKKLDT